MPAIGFAVIEAGSHKTIVAKAAPTVAGMAASYRAS
jgi:hypothetical protein